LGNGVPCSDDRAVDILLNAARFAVETCAIDPLPAGDNRWLLTVQARELTSGALFVVATTHLLDGKAAADDQPRRVQAAAIVSLLAARNPAGLPVILTGDLNSAEATAVDAAPSIIAAAGYVGTDLVARTLQNAQYNTSHGWTQAYQVAEHIDHIMASAKVVANSFGVHYGDPAAEPSDHFAISANLSVYPS
jgi:endonuclease/exonuclease/phosphatase family metal-dependent hydrolase